MAINTTYGSEKIKNKAGFKKLGIDNAFSGVYNTSAF